MSGFFSRGKADTNSFDRSKLPAGPSGGTAVYKVRVSDICDHYGAQAGDRTQLNFTVVGGPKDGKAASHLVMHKHPKSFMEDKARGEIAASVGAFKGFTRDQSGFRITSENYYNDVRTVEYDSSSKASKTSGESTDLPLVKSGAEAFLVVEGYFKTDKATGKTERKYNKGQPSVTYKLLPLSANLVVSTEFEGEALGDDEDAPPPSDEPEAPATVDALAAALADGWKVNPKAPQFFYKKGETDQLKEAALRARYAA